MGVIISVECQKCETVHNEEIEGVLVLGKKLNNGKLGYCMYYHDLSDSELLELVAHALEFLAEQFKE